MRQALLLYQGNSKMLNRKNNGFVIGMFSKRKQEIYQLRHFFLNSSFVPIPQVLHLCYLLFVICTVYYIAQTSAALVINACSRTKYGHIQPGCNYNQSIIVKTKVIGFGYNGGNNWSATTIR